MEFTRLDRISKALAHRRLSRRQTLATGAAGLAAAGVNRAGVAQEATPAPELPSPDAGHGPEMLFVQTYQSGTITPIEGIEGRYTLTLEAGTGQTIYFSDRPDRIVGASPTPRFLEGLGFPSDNPPNAALVVETTPGETDVAVVELFEPLFDPISQSVSYEIEVLANWQDELEMGFHEAPTDLAALAPTFGAAHLFIDGCSEEPLICQRANVGDIGEIPSSEFDTYCYHYQIYDCVPCVPDFDYDSPQVYAELHAYWDQQCNSTFAACENGCTAAWHTTFTRG